MDRKSVHSWYHQNNTVWEDCYLVAYKSEILCVFFRKNYVQPNKVKRKKIQHTWIFVPKRLQIRFWMHCILWNPYIFFILLSRCKNTCTVIKISTNHALLLHTLHSYGEFFSRFGLFCYSSAMQWKRNELVSMNYKNCRYEMI